MAYPATSFSSAVDLTITAANQIHEVVNGDSLSTILVETGEIPSLRKALVDNFYFISPIDWDLGNDETVFNQLRTFTDGSVWWAPTATVSNPVEMTADPYVDSNWALSIVGNKNYIDEAVNAGDSFVAGGNIWPVYPNSSAQIGDQNLVNVRFVNIDGIQYVIDSLVSGDITDIDVANFTIDIDSVEYKLLIKFNELGQIDVSRFGVSSSSSQAEVKTALQLAISYANKIGGGEVFVPSNLNYGYKRVDVSTYPDFTGVTVDMVVVDRSIGATNPAPAKDGSQTRYFYYTYQAEVGNTDGNGQWINGAWAPYLFLNNTANLAPAGDPSRTASDNRRNTIFWANDGATTWGWGQGSGAGDSLTNDELSGFRGVVNDLPDLGISGLTKWLAINKENGGIGFHTDVFPTTIPYEFIIRNGFGNGSFIIRRGDGDPQIRVIGTSGEATISPNPSGLQLIANGNVVYQSSFDGSSQRFISQSGNVNLFLNAQSTSRRVLLSNATSEIRMQATNNTTNTFVHDDTGNLSITGSYSPFTGTHRFFSPVDIPVGMAVDLVSADKVDYHTHSEQEDGTWKTSIIKMPGTVAITTTKHSKICAGVCQRTEPMENGFAVYVAQVGDNDAGDLVGFIVNDENGQIEAGDILVTSSKHGELMKYDEGLPETVVRFKAMSPPDENNLVYGYF